MAMFGQRKPAFGQIPGLQRGPYDTPPTWGGPPQETMGEVGAMDPNTQAMTKKPGFFAPGQTGRHIVGFIGDALQQMSGGQPTYMPQMMQMKQQDAEIRARLQAALEQRKAAREDKQWEWENKPRNDELANLMRNAGIDPDSPQGIQMYSAALTNKVYPERMIPFVDAQGNEGLMRTRSGMPPQQQGGIQEGATATNPETNEKIIFRNGKWQPVGGSVGNGTGGF